ncbi:MAG: hypothetical protein AB7P42_12100, partial [Gammaproteobacteria bacterium]
MPNTCCRSRRSRRSARYPAKRPEQEHGTRNIGPATRQATDMSAVINIAHISDAEFQQLRDWLYERSGINLSDAKKQLVMG